jgi:hypothetical protein
VAGGFLGFDVDARDAAAPSRDISRVARRRPVSVVSHAATRLPCWHGASRP